MVFEGDYVDVNDQDIQVVLDHNEAREEVLRVFESIRRFTISYESYSGLLDRLTYDALFELLYGRDPVFEY